MILSCEKCSGWGHEQDSLHGKGQRVHNQMKDVSKARCTVCGNVRSVKTSVVPVNLPKRKEV